tara:strand:- start:190 stop:630 length:441 start_codon:yes stop_codon:yes gene_type:complete
MLKKIINLLSNKTRIELRFIYVGIFNTVLGYSLFYILDYFFETYFDLRYLAYMLAIIIGQFFSIISAFFTHKYITFKSINRGKKMINEFFKFSLTYSFVFFLNLVLLPVIVEFFNISPRIAALIIIFFGAIISYYGHLKFSFNTKH